MKQWGLDKYYKFRFRLGSAASLIPGFKPWLIRRYNLLLNRKKRLVVSFARKMNPISKQELVSHFQTLGLGKGHAVMVHSSLSRLGYVEGGEDTVIEAFLEVLGRRGTLLMPAYPVADFSVENLRALPILETHTASLTGSITNRLLSWPGSLVSFHPTHRWVGVGPDADYLLKDHHQSVTPCGPCSPFERMLEIDGWVMTLGSRWGQCTFWHIIEDRVDFPLEVYYPGQFSAPVRFPDSEVRSIQFRLHSPTLAPLRIDSRFDHEIAVLKRFREWGLVRERKVGLGMARAVRARDFMAGLDLLLKQGITIYADQP
jgi:aminoglycoside 3-N-acetyltransferase